MFMYLVIIGLINYATTGDHRTNEATFCSEDKRQGRC